MIESIDVVAGTGHRPPKLGGYGPGVQGKLRRLLVSRLERIAPEKVLSGMALGFDTALAHAALDLSIPFDAIVPFVGQERLWPRASQLEYHRLLHAASNVVIVSIGGFSQDKMQIRNEYLVDYSDLLLALWDGSLGGTHNCIKYAERKGRVIQPLWQDWINAA